MESITAQTLRSRLASYPGATLEFPFGQKTSVFKIGGRMYALLGNAEGHPRVTLKCDPVLAPILRHEHPAITPGYYMNKAHWNTVYIDGTVPRALVFDMMDASYDLVRASLPRWIREILPSPKCAP